jgi:hypothetical protein
LNDFTIRPMPLPFRFLKFRPEVRPCVVMNSVV